MHARVVVQDAIWCDGGATLHTLIYFVFLACKKFWKWASSHTLIFSPGWLSMHVRVAVQDAIQYDGGTTLWFIFYFCTKSYATQFQKWLLFWHAKSSRNGPPHITLICFHWLIVNACKGSGTRHHTMWWGHSPSHNDLFFIQITLIFTLIYFLFLACKKVPETGILTSWWFFPTGWLLMHEG